MGTRAKATGRAIRFIDMVAELCEERSRLTDAESKYVAKQLEAVLLHAMEDADEGKERFGRHWTLTDTQITEAVRLAAWGDSPSEQEVCDEWVKARKAGAK